MEESNAYNNVKIVMSVTVFKAIYNNYTVVWKHPTSNDDSHK